MRRNALGLGRDKTYFDLRSASPKIAVLLDTAVLLGGMLKPEELFNRSTFELVSVDEDEALKFLKAVKETGEYDDSAEHTIENLKRLVVKLQKFIEELEKI